MNKISYIQFDTYHQLLQPRARDAHKGLFGHVVVLGGDEGMPGAVRLAAEAALRVGAGRVTVATRFEHVAAIVSARPEIMAHGIKSAAELKSLFAKATVIVVGPGLGQSEWSLQLFKAALSILKPKVVDADALNLLSQHHQKSDDWILTPHAGEAARLLQCSVDDINQNRIQAVTQLQRRYGAVAVLKGAGSLMCGANSLSQCEAGNPGMASAGMGDVLSGVIGGLLAQGFSLREAAECGVCLHAMAGDRAAKEGGERALLASDVISYLRLLVNI